MAEQDQAISVADTQRFDFKLSERFRGYLPVVVDVETAGFNPEKNALLEIAMQTVIPHPDGTFEPGQLLSANIRPFAGSELNESNLKFLNIADPFDESRNLKNEEEVLPEFFKVIKKEIKAQGCTRAILVGHNGSFDLGFVLAAAKRVGWEKKCPFHPFSVLDTGSMSALMYGQTVLAKACRAAGLDFDASEAHGAAYDTQMECRLFCTLINSFTRFAGVPDPKAAE